MKKLVLNDKAHEAPIKDIDCKVQKHPFVIEKPGFQSVRFLCKEHIDPLLHDGYSMRMLDTEAQ